MKRDLKRIVGFCEVVVPSYAIDEFRSHFQMKETTFEVLAREFAACTLKKRTLSSSHVDAFHVTQMKIGVSPSTGFDFPFRYSVWEFWTTFQDVPFILENFRSGKPKQPY